MNCVPYHFYFIANSELGKFNLRNYNLIEMAPPTFPIKERRMKFVRLTQTKNQKIARNLIF